MSVEEFLISMYEVLDLIFGGNGQRQREIETDR